MPRIVALLLAASSCLVSAAPDVKINRFEDRDGATLYIQTKDLLDATVGIEVSGENLQVSGPIPCFFDTSGRTNFPALIIGPKDKQRAWNYKYKFSWQCGGRSGIPDNYEYSPPFPADASYNVRQGYLGAFSHRECTEDQYSIDWEMPVGTIVCAAREGTVVSIVQHWNEGGADEVFREKANSITIRHADGTYGNYVHLKQNGAAVLLGEKVQLGQPIGFSGNTGYSSGPHVHFSVYRLQTKGFKVMKETLPVAFRDVEARYIKPRGSCPPKEIGPVVVIPQAKSRAN